MVQADGDEKTQATERVLQKLVGWDIVRLPNAARGEA
jgi:hypothetical protein